MDGKKSWIIQAHPPPPPRRPACRYTSPITYFPSVSVCPLIGGRSSCPRPPFFFSKDALAGGIVADSVASMPMPGAPPLAMSKGAAPQAESRDGE